jgi:hypothetical protein
MHHITHVALPCASIDLFRRAFECMKHDIIALRDRHSLRDVRRPSSSMRLFIVMR